jgi:hypothetical protein
MAVATYLRYLSCNQKVAEIIAQFAGIYPLSFRTLERITAYSKIILISMPKNGLFLPQIIFLLCVIKVVRPVLYESIQKSKCELSELNDFARFNFWRDELRPNVRTPLSERVEKWWAFALGALDKPGDAQNLERALLEYNIQPIQILPYYCRLADGVEFPGGV